MYRNEGYLDAAVTAATPVFEDGRATLPVGINEGPLFQLESVTFTGLEARSPEEAAKAFGLKAGTPATRANVDAAVQALARWYHTDGFNKVRITVMSDATAATGRVALTLDVDEGARQVLRDVAIAGTRRTSPALVSRELKLDPGKPVDLSELAQARKRLYDTSMFRQVDVEAMPIEAPDAAPAGEAEQPTRARVTVDEWPPLRIRYGFEVDDEAGPLSESRVLQPGAAADLTYRNVLGRAASTGLAFRYTKDFDAARVFWSMPSFLGLPLVSNVFVERSREEFYPDQARPYFANKLTFTAEQRFRAGRRLQLAYSYGFDRNQTIDANYNPDDPLSIDSTIDVAKLTGTALVDTRNDLVDASSGFMTSSTFEYGIGALGSDVRFAKYFFQQNYYRPLTGQLVFATSARIGLAAGFGQELIPSERFLAGGSNSVRGYAEDSLGPIDIFGPGGNALLVFNEELRFPILGRFRGVGFFDAGNTFATVGDLSLRQLRSGIGIGLRVHTPFALLRGDIGTPIAPRPNESRLRFYFSIGQSF
jgi:outer membrane protein assembly complex protein YaeT